MPKSYLIASKELEKTNSIVAKVIQEELSFFFFQWQTFAFLSNPYMGKIGEKLKIFYPNLIHVTCLSHRLNSVAEENRKHFRLVNNFISTTKKLPQSAYQNAVV